MLDKVRYEEINLEDLRHQQLILVLSKLNNFYVPELKIILHLKQKRDQLEGIIAFEGNKAIAFILYEGKCLTRYGMTTINFHLVDKNHRKKSVGSELLKQVEERFDGKVIGVEVDVRQLSKNYYKKMGYNFKYARCPITNKKLTQIKYVDKYAPYIQIMFKLCETQQNINMANNAMEIVEKMIKEVQKDEKHLLALQHIIIFFIQNEYDNKKSDAEFQNIKQKTYTLSKNLKNNTITDEDKIMLLYITMKLRKIGE